MSYTTSITGVSVIRSICLFFALSLSATCQSQTLFPEGELVKFDSLQSHLDRTAIIGKRPILRQGIHGYFFPAEGGGRAATVIYIHSSSGLYRRLLGQWIEPLTRAGYNVFVPDSFSPRGITTTTSDQTQLSDYTVVIDALRALHAISFRSDVDPARVAVIGGSKGGIVAYESLYREYRDAAQIGGLAFKLHIPLYPTCNWNDWSANYTGGSVFALLGGMDDFTPASICVAHFTRMKNTGARIDWKIYPEFHHGFDNSRGVQFLPRAATARRCGVYVDLSDLKVKRRSDDSVILDPSEHYSSCNERGAHTGGTPDQAATVAAEVLEILRSQL